MESILSEKNSGKFFKIKYIGAFGIGTRDHSSYPRRYIEWNGLSLSDDGKHSRLELFKCAIDEIDELEESLNLSDEIKNFIVKVTTGKARISDVNDNIITWIREENLKDRFVINFKS